MDLVLRILVDFEIVTRQSVELKRIDVNSELCLIFATHSLTEPGDNGVLREDVVIFAPETQVASVVHEAVKKTKAPHCTLEALEEQLRFVFSNHLWIRCEELFHFFYISFKVF